MTTCTLETTTISEKAAQEEIRDVVRDLEALRFRLVGVRASLPAPESEEEGEGDAAVDLRAVLDCVLADSIGPALQDLRKLVDEG
jgi:hypothetical protein